MIDDFIQSGIISSRRAANIETKVVFLDATFVLPGSGANIHDNYKQQHIDGALFFDIACVCDTESDLPHMLPSRDVFEQTMRRLGIQNSDIIIVYGQNGMLMGPARVWWMLKGFGHHNVVVLNGGLPAWIGEGLLTVSGEQPNLKASEYSAVEFDRMNVITLEEMTTISDGSICTILDARPEARFSGEAQEPRAGMRSGHIPNSTNLACSQLVDEHGRFKTKLQLSKLLDSVDLSGRVVTTCGSGITACALALALYHLGHEDVAVYDGSWSEWGHEDSGTRVN